MASEAPLLRRTTNEPSRTPTTKSQTSVCAQSSPEQQPQCRTPKYNVWYRIKRALTRTAPTPTGTSEAASDREPHWTSEKEGRSFNSWSSGATKLFRRDRSDSASTGANTDNNGYVVTPASTLSSHRHLLRHPEPQHDNTPSFNNLHSPSRVLNKQAAERETHVQDTESSRLFLRAPPFRHRQREKRTPVWEVFVVEEPTDEEQARRAFALLETCGAETARSGNPLAADRRRFDEGGEDEDGGEAPVRRPVLGARF
ncbi:hypothetical protein BFW01_g6756 [Lasiodiplodia theobromae]|uniref:Phosphoglycerate mutase family protein n=1 Tax=Lasiodiplodia theobromae TaxID=45133 RepID=UPI0015C31AF1|nr:Phosphoglycerate mutase family protein [Lasiodiplodia theobromae]KAF4542399.1 Phosphoglycerate mutase family protein [Lasiodiplodia theobromae]KAF9635861.1 hypothetical protein BFW01_g6756 [Lasiodiplodia theobromae]